MANAWFRMYSEFATDPKVQMMSESNQRRLTMVLCLRCNGGVTLQDEEIAFQLRISNEEWGATKAMFIDKGFIDSSNNVLNWDKRQFVSDSSAERVARHRDKKKKQCNVTVTPPDTDTDTDTDTEKKKEVAAAPCAHDDGMKKIIVDREKQLSETDLLKQAGIDGQLAKDFLKMRKTKKAPLTQTAVDGLIREAGIAGISATDAVRICINRNWQGFNAGWDWQSKKPASSTLHQPKQSRMSLAGIDYNEGVNPDGSF